MTASDVPGPVGPATGSETSAVVPGACAHGGAVRCWPCMTDGCFEQPTLHPWWDDEDVEHAANTGQAKPSGHCGCAFCGAPAVERASRRGAR